MPKLLVTVDAEPSRYCGKPLPYEIMMEGRLDGGVHGIERLMALSEAAGGKATFFLDVLARRAYGERLRESAELLAARGHDVQIHTHPLWVSERNTMPQYSRDEQRELLEECWRCIEAWTGCAPVAHRAGDLAANEDTIAALRELSIDVDSSYGPGWPRCAALADLFAVNRPSLSGGLLEIPITAFTSLKLPPLSRHRLFDFNSVTLSEGRTLLRQAKRLELPYVLVLLHSFSLLSVSADRKRFRFDAAADERLQALLDEAAMLDYELLTIREYRDLLHAEGAAAAEDERPGGEAVPLERDGVPARGADSPTPVMGPWITYLGAMQRFSVSRKARLVALAPPLGLLLILLLFLLMKSA